MSDENNSLPTVNPSEGTTSAENLYEFIGAPSLEQFNAYADNLYKDVKERGIDPVDNVILNLHINALYGSSLLQPGEGMKRVFNAITDITGFKNITLKDGSQIVMGNIYSTEETAGSRSQEKYQLPHIVKTLGQSSVQAPFTPN